MVFRRIVTTAAGRHHTSMHLYVAGLWRYPVKSLRDIGRRFGGRLALNADVVRAGTIALGDPVTLVPPDPAGQPGRHAREVNAAGRLE
jgi:hypothetical protein